MYNLKEYSNQEIVDLVKNKKVSVADLVDSGICPTCFNKKNGQVLYGDNKEN